MKPASRGFKATEAGLEAGFVNKASQTQIPNPGRCNPQSLKLTRLHTQIPCLMRPVLCCSQHLPELRWDHIIPSALGHGPETARRHVWSPSCLESPGTKTPTSSHQLHGILPEGGVFRRIKSCQGGEASQILNRRVT